MLTKIILKNFKSFSSETTIDVTATNYQMLTNTNVRNKVLKGLLFVGSNATGKTNALLSIKFLLDLLFARDNIDVKDYICFFPSSLEMFLEYTFNIQDDNIVYGFEFSRMGEVTKEYLSVNKKPMLYRIKNSVESNLTEKRIYDEKDVDKNTLFLRNIYFNTKFSGFDSLRAWFSFLSNSLYVNAVSSFTQTYNVNNHYNNIIKYLDKHGPDKINEFFDFFGFDQEICYENEHKISDLVLGKMIGNTKEVFLKKNSINLWMPLAYESLGNTTLLNMLPAVLASIENNCILLIDEFSSAFHNELEELIVKYFMKKADKSQLFIVSHSTNLLSTTLLRPDQIYSTNFKDESGTYLHRFSREKPRESQNLEKMYLNGIFNGIPRYKNTEYNN